MEDGRWRWWSLFALSEFLSLYTWKAALHPIAAINLSILLILCVKRRRDYLQFARWLVVNIAVLMVFVPLFAPAIPQIKRKLAVSSQAHGEMGLAWLKDVLAEGVGGADWVVLGWWVPLLMLFFLGFFIVGLMRLRGLWSGLLIAAPVAGAGLAFLHFTLTNNELLKWYIFYTLPFLLIFVALGLERLRFAACGMLVLYLVAVGGIFLDRVASPLQHGRAAAMVTRNTDEGVLDMGPTKLVTVGLYRACTAYDPRIRQSRGLRNGEALMEVVNECRADGKPLRVSASNLGFANLEHPSFFAVLHDPKLFRKSGSFPGAEPYLDIETFELIEP